MSNVMYAEWIKNIEIGQFVAEERYECYTLVKVVSKTAIGSLKLENDDLLKIDSNWSRRRRHYLPITDEILHRIEVQNKEKELNEVLKKTKILDLTINQMDRIIEILKENKL